MAEADLVAVAAPAHLRLREHSAEAVAASPAATAAADSVVAAAAVDSAAAVTAVAVAAAIIAEDRHSNRENRWPATTID